MPETDLTSLLGWMRCPSCAKIVDLLRKTVKKEEGKKVLCANCHSNGVITLIKGDYMSYDLVPIIKRVIGKISTELKPQLDNQPTVDATVRHKDDTTKNVKLKGGRLMGTWELMKEGKVPMESLLEFEAPSTAFDKVAIDKFWSAFYEVEKEVQVVRCPICFGLVEYPCLTPCDHTFCLGCIERYFTEQSRSTDSAICPLRCTSPWDEKGLNGVTTSPILYFTLQMHKAFTNTGPEEERPTQEPYLSKIKFLGEGAPVVVFLPFSFRMGYLQESFQQIECKLVITDPGDKYAMIILRRLRADSIPVMVGFTKDPSAESAQPSRAIPIYSFNSISFKVKDSLRVHFSPMIGDFDENKVPWKELSQVHNLSPACWGLESQPTARRWWNQLGIHRTRPNVA